jgi:hypothetical protein
MVNEPDTVLTGAAFELASAGYRPMSDAGEEDDKEAIGSDSASLREAAERRSRPSDEIIVREYIDKSDQPAGAEEAITLDRAVRDYVGATTVDKLLAEHTTSKELAAQVDAMRAEAWASDPDASEFEGFELPRDKADQAEPGKADSGKLANEPADPGANRTANGLDPDLEKALNHPQVVQAIEQRIGEAEKTRQSYLNGLAAAT